MGNPYPPFSIVRKDEFVKSPENVIPAQAGIYKYLKILDSRRCGNDRKS